MPRRRWLPYSCCTERDDNVIPALESTLLADHLRPHTAVRVLLTPLITHAEVNRPADWGEIWKLVSFWTDVLDE